MVLKIIIFDKKSRDYHKNYRRINNVAENQPEVLKLIGEFVGEAIPRWNRQINGKYSTIMFIKCNIKDPIIYLTNSSKDVI